MPGMNRSIARTLAVISLVALSGVLATGCLSGEAELEVRADGTGSVSVEVFPPGRMTEDLDVDGLEELLGGSAASSDVLVEKVDRDGVEGFRVEVSFDDYQAAIGALQGGTTVAGQSVGLFSSLSVVELPDGEGWELVATLVPLDQVAGTSAGGSTDLDGLLDAAGLSSAGSGFDLSVALPGNVASSNADSTDGGTATWRLADPEVPATLRMRTEPAPLVTPYRLIVGGAGLAVLIGLLLAVAGASRPYRTSRRARRRSRTHQVGNPVSSDGWAGPGPSGSGAPGHAAPAPSARPVPLPPLAPAAASQRATGPSAPAHPGAPPTHGPGAPSAPTDPLAPPPFAGPMAPAVPASPSGVQPTHSPGPVTAPSPGWYADPTNETGHRWWDGERWTDHTS